MLIFFFVLLMLIEAPTWRAKLGGAFGRVKPGSGALAAFDAEFAYMALSVPMTPEMGMAIKGAMADMREALAPYQGGKRYLNFTEDQVHSSAFFDDDVHARLAAVRRRVDPDGTMRANHQIDASR